jgi:thiamine biosynthesis lipoprotein
MTASSSTFVFDGIGTRWEIVTPRPVDSRLRGLVLGTVQAFDRAWSRFRDDSLVTRLAREGGCAEFPPEAPALFDLYDRLHEATAGAVDPLVGRDLELLGYDTHYTLHPAIGEDAAAERQRPRRRWDRNVRRDGRTVTVCEPTLIDVGAVGKGLLVDLVGDLLRDEGVAGSLVDASGDMRHRGGDAVRVGLEHPYLPDRVLGVIELGDAALCASSTTRRRWGPGLHHVLDGRTGRPVTDIVATWAFASDTATADGIATALFSTPAERLASRFEFTSVRMHRDGRIETWGEFPGELLV